MHFAEIKLSTEEEKYDKPHNSEVAAAAGKRKQREKIMMAFKTKSHRECLNLVSTILR